MPGSPVLVGTWTGEDVALPMRAVPPPVPVGMDRSPVTGPEFGAYVVMPAAE